MGEYGHAYFFRRVAENHDDPNPEIRKATLWSLYRIGCFPAFDYISKHTNDSDIQVNRLANRLLRNFPKVKLRSWIIENSQREMLNHETFIGVKKAGTEIVLIDKLAKNENERKLLEGAFSTPKSIDAVRRLVYIIR